MQKRQTPGHAGQTIRSIQILLIFLEEEVARANDIDRNAGVLRNLPRLTVVDLAEGINAGGHQYDGTAPALYIHQTRVIGFIRGVQEQSSPHHVNEGEYGCSFRLTACLLKVVERVKMLEGFHHLFIEVICNRELPLALVHDSSLEGEVQKISDKLILTLNI